MKLMISRLAFFMASASLFCFGATIPRPAPELMIKTVGGGETRLSSMKGKVIAVEFILTTCPHCQNSSRNINKVYNELGAKGFTAVGVAVNQMSQLYIPDFIRDHKINYLIGYQHQDAADAFLQHTPQTIMYFPQFVLIDRKGMIRYQFDGNDKHFENEEKSLREKVLQLLNEGGSPASKK